MHDDVPTSMRLTDCLAADLVLPAVAAERKDEVLELLAAQLAAAHPAIDRGLLIAALRERERQASTALLDGVAIPHAKLPGLPRVVAALARSRAGIDCDSHDGKPTHLFLLLVAPAEAPGAHLKMLATVSRLLHDQHCRTRLMNVHDDADALWGALREAEERAHPAVRAA